MTSARAQDEAEVYDLRGLKCPLPVMKTRKRLSTMPAGSGLWVETTDPLAVIDIPHFCHEDGHALEDHLYLVDPMGEWMMRMPADPDPARLRRDLDRLLRASASWDSPGR